MKQPRFFILAFLFQLPVFSFAAGISDTTIRGVVVQTTSDSSIFPPEWRAGPINAKEENLDPGEAGRSLAVISRALNKYPAELLKKNLIAVYFIKSMKFYDAVGFGGTNSSDAVYITNNGIPLGYTDHYLEQTFHHEFSSILFRNFPQLLDTNAWKKANIPGFDYNDPEAGVGAIRKKQSSQEADSLLASKGFLTQYAMSGIENDVNTLAQNLFKPGPLFWNFVNHFPRISQKIKLLIGLYHSINPLFTEQYFRSFNKPQPGI